MVGTVISHYRILEKLGEGGMGVVYKAQDTKLDRFVALKFLPSHVAKSEQEKSRFFQEAKSASALNHPNVCTIYGIDEADEMQFIEMELVDGATLREKVASSSPLPIKQVVDYAIQIAEALQEAHSKGIIHRDIKAENIMVNSKDQIKVMDFGLAKLKGSLKLTRTSSTIGTLAYMSPEQIQGIEADTRSDIFSYGVVLFEMTTGKMPFRGEHDAAVMYSIVNEEPENASKFRNDIPDELLHIMKKSLEKDPEDRYQSMSEIIVDLRRLKKESTRVVRTKEFQTGAGLKKQSAAVPKQQMLVSRQSMILGAAVIVLLLGGFFFKDSLRSIFSRDEKKVIVVLPFENLGPDDKNYFVDGMTDEVTSRLSGLSGLKVIARSSAVQYRNTTKTLKQIGEELRVNYILQGTVRWETVDGKTNVRVNPTLIRVEDETQAWSESIESVLSSAFKLQSDIAARVAGAMNVALAKTEERSLNVALTENSEAYDNYLQAVDYADRSIAKSDQEIAMKLFEKAIRLDPNFAAAYARLGKAHASFYWFFYDRSAERIEKARLAAEKSVELSPELSEAHEAMGWFHYHTKLDYENALKEFDLALKYRPNNAQVHYGIAAVMRRQGNMQGSIDAFKRSIESNPRAADILRQLGETLTLQRKYEEADANHNRSLELAPDIMVTYWDKTKNLLLWKGDLTIARSLVAEARKIGKTEETEYSIDDMDFYVEMSDGKYDRAVDILNSSGTDAVRNTQFYFAPNVLLRATLERMRNNSRLAKLYYDSSIMYLERKLRQNPNDERVYSALGLAYAGLGMKAKAVEYGSRAMEMLPAEKEAWRGSCRMIDMAEIYTTIGEEEKALDLIERLLIIPAELSSVYLKLDPVWKPLQSNKRFQKLVH
jgi:serine/threonine protein kinase/tetratricopeptide (TPR) repeat protein